jgi:hypothetical protein
VAVKDIVEKLKTKGFLWCLIHQDKIDNQISDVEHRIKAAFDMFNVSMSYTLVTLLNVIYTENILGGISRRQRQIPTRYAKSAASRPERATSETRSAIPE